MATISSATTEKVVSLRAFLGMNEHPDGDNKLKTGEASVCRNFKITDSGNLMKRYGTTLQYTLGTDKPVMGMWHGMCSHHELLIAACDGHLWMLQDNEMKPYPVDLGSVSTANDVSMFGYAEQVFMLNGVEYGHVYYVANPVPATVTAVPSGTGVSGATVDNDAFIAKVESAGVYVFYYNGENWAIGAWTVIEDIEDEYGITVTGTPVTGDKITVTYTAASDGAWYYENLADGNHGYVPLVATAVEPKPGSGGELLEEVNKLNGKRRVWISTDGVGDTFVMPETFHSIDKIIKLSDGSTVPVEDYSWTEDTNEVQFDTAPALAVNGYEIQYSVETNFADTVASMRYAELYAGGQDTRLFIYGNGTNRAFYSSNDYWNQPRGDYFPDLYEITVGDSNTPITGLIRHYSRMLAFKPEATFAVDYGVERLADGTDTPSFYTTPCNRILGNDAPGQVQLVLNAPRTLCKGNLYEWRSASSYAANLSVDERQAKLISERINSTLRQMDFSSCHCFDDNLNHEYYIVADDGNMLVHNYTADAWYQYTGLNARVLMAVDGRLYIGTKDGKILLLDKDAMSDDGAPIDCYWESGSMDFGAANMRKSTALLWIGVKAEDKNAVTVTVKTDRTEENAEVEVEPEYEFAMPKMTRCKIKAKKFVFYKLILKTNSAATRVTVVDAEIKVRYTAQAK